MADFTFNQPLFGAVGLLPDNPVEVNIGFGLGIESSSNVILPAITLAGFGLGIEVNAIQHCVVVNAGFGLEVSCEVQQNGSVNISTGFGLGISLQIPNTKGSNVSIGFGLGVSETLIQHNGRISVGFGLGCSTTIEQEQPVAIECGFGLGLITYNKSTRFCKVPEHTVNRWT